MLNLSVNREAFCQAYAKMRQGPAAYREAFPKSQAWKESAVNTAASKLLAVPAIKARIKELTFEPGELLTMRIADVLNRWCMIATADPRELVRKRNCNCRYCNGQDGEYQWRDEAEYWDALAQAARAEELRQEMRPKAPAIRLPVNTGGYGFRDNGPVNLQCPKCNGEGVTDVYVEAAENLSPQAVMLLAGYEQTKNGIKVHMHDQHAALNNVAKFLGMLVDKVKHEGGIATTPSSLTPEQAAAVAKALVDKI